MNLHEHMIYIESKGFDVFPIKEKKGIRFTIWKGNSIIKIGSKYYKDLMQGQREVYKILYQAITK